MNSAVVDIERGEKKFILIELGKLGISSPIAVQLVEKYGQQRVKTVIGQSKHQKCINPAGYIIRALKENWTFYSVHEKEDYASGNGLAYITGKYAAFIQH